MPVFRENNAARPPVRIWDSVVATGAARALSPNLLFRLAMFYNCQNSFGERYALGDLYRTAHLPAWHGPAGFYDASGKLRPEFVAYVDRRRDLLAASRNLTAQARALRAELVHRN